MNTILLYLREAFSSLLLRAYQKVSQNYAAHPILAVGMFSPTILVYGFIESQLFSFDNSLFSS
jgi:hypothetical protein